MFRRTNRRSLQPRWRFSCPITISVNLDRRLSCLFVCKTKLVRPHNCPYSSMIQTNQLPVGRSQIQLVSSYIVCLPTSDPLLTLVSGPWCLPIRVSLLPADQPVSFDTSTIWLASVSLECRKLQHFPFQAAKHGQTTVRNLGLRSRRLLLAPLQTALG